MEKLKIQMEIVMDLMQRKNNYMMQNLVLIGIIFMFISCDNSIVFEKYKSFQNQEWNTDSLVKFEYFINDTITKHKCILKIRHSVDYDFQNLFLFIYSDLSKDTVELLRSTTKSPLFLGSHNTTHTRLKPFRRVVFSLCLNCRNTLKKLVVWQM